MSAGTGTSEDVEGLVAEANRRIASAGVTMYDRALLGSLRALIERLSAERDAEREVAANRFSVIADLEARLASVEQERDEAVAWNHSVSVCDKHTALIVGDGCYVCDLALARAEEEVAHAEAETLRDALRGVLPVFDNDGGPMSVYREVYADRIAAAERALLTPTPAEGGSDASK